MINNKGERNRAIPQTGVHNSQRVTTHAQSMKTSEHGRSNSNSNVAWQAAKNTQLQTQSQKDSSTIMSLKQELIIVKKEKRFIQEKLNEVTSKSADPSKELNERKIENERTKYENAEKERVELKAELDLIQQQLDNETDALDRCRHYLEPEEEAKLEETKAYSSAVSGDQP